MAPTDYSPLAGPGGPDDPTDRTTYFFSDSNGRSPGNAQFPAGTTPPGYLAPPFNDGDQFYYFITARDILGRDGLVDQEDPRWGIAVAERERTGSAVGVARLRRGDGRFMEVEMTASHYRAEDGATHTCCILHDMTGRLAVERELEELSARLLRLSRGDELTGFQNRRGLVAAGTQLLQFADRQQAAVHALFVD